MSKVIVTGGRDYSDWDKVQKVLDLFDIDAIIQGGAKGADRLARAYAVKHGMVPVTFDADWTKHGLAAGPIRNKEMLVAHPDAIVIAFPGQKGTRNCIETAAKLGHLVIEVK